MCVICHKPKGAKLPDASVIGSMWDTNPHGAGVMFRNGRRVRYVKGFMDKNEFMEWLEANRAALDKTECALHFRITTHGGTNPENCHPFPLDKWTKVHALTGSCKRAFMHNGILPIEPREARLSDTAEYSIRAKESGNAALFIKSTAEFVEPDNRLCVFLPHETLLIGDWKRRYVDDGCNYSNLHFDWKNQTFTFSPTTQSKKKYTHKAGMETYDDKSFMGYYYDTRKKCWMDSFGRRANIFDVDPTWLGEDDYDQYCQDIEAWEHEYTCAHPDILA